MELPDEEQRLTYGFRLRSNGALLRFSTVSQEYGDDVSEFTIDTHSFSTDPEHPIYDAGSVENLGRAFLPTDGREPHRPLPNGIAREDVEPVVLVETVSRRIAPVSPVFERSADIADRAYAIDIDRNWIRKVEGLGEMIEAVHAHRGELEGQTEGGYPCGGYRFVGLVSTVDPSDLPDDLPGAIVTSGKSILPRRGLAVFPFEGGTHLSANGRDPVRSLVVCLSDSRRLPESLEAHLRSLAAPGPAPR
jgi:hypothetical protein